MGYDGASMVIVITIKPHCLHMNFNGLIYTYLVGGSNTFPPNINRNSSFLFMSKVVPKILFSKTNLSASLHGTIFSRFIWSDLFWKDQDFKGRHWEHLFWTMLYLKRKRRSLRQKLITLLSFGKRNANKKHMNTTQLPNPQRDHQ